MTFAKGARTARGSCGATCCVARCVPPRANAGGRVLGLSIVNRSRPWKKGSHGYDAYKQVNGRRPHTLVDPLGLLLAVIVMAASVQHRDGTKHLLEVLR